jgi:hypothetical protein
MPSIAMKFFQQASVRLLLMRSETVPRACTLKQIPDIPLHLIPKTIADVIKGKRTSLYRITVKKTFQNRYRVIIETRKRGYRRFVPPKHFSFFLTENQYPEY